MLPYDYNVALVDAVPVLELTAWPAGGGEFFRDTDDYDLCTLVPEIFNDTGSVVGGSLFERPLAGDRTEPRFMLHWFLAAEGLTRDNGGSDTEMYAVLRGTTPGAVTGLSNTGHTYLTLLGSPAAIQLINSGFASQQDWGSGQSGVVEIHSRWLRVTTAFDGTAPSGGFYFGLYARVL